MDAYEILTKTPRDLMRNIYSILETGQGQRKLYLKPFNRFDPDESDWWIIPSNDWPAYKYCKYFADWGMKPEEDYLWVGLCIEKGFGSDAKGFENRNKIMGKEWAWHSWLKDITNGNLIGDLDIRKISKPQALGFYISGGYSEVKVEKWDKYIFRLKRNNRLSLIYSKEDQGLFGKISQSTTEEELAKELTKIADNQWLWINIYLYVKCRYSKTAKSVWPEILWDEVLRHWADKVK